MNFILKVMMELNIMELYLNVGMYILAVILLLYLL